MEKAKLNLNLKLNQNYKGVADGYSSEFHGVIHTDGGTVFVPGVLRGEEIEFKIIKLMKNAAAGELIKIIKPAPARRAPDCPYFRQCGGCDCRHISYPEELDAKRQRVQDALCHIGGVNINVEMITRPQDTRPLYYRNKAQFPVDSNGMIGFYRSGSHEIIPVKSCLLLSNPANQTADAVRNWMARYHIPGYDERTGKGLIRHIYIRTNQAGGSLCALVINGKKIPREPELIGMIRAAAPDTTGIIFNINTRRDNVILGEKFKTIWGQPYLTDLLHGLKFQLSAPSFYQVNREQAEKIYQKALEYADLTGDETILDLYCGIGTISLYFARHAGQVIGAEIIPQAVRDAEANAKRNQIYNIKFICADASETARTFAQTGFAPDIIITDPPRKGLTPEGIQAITSMNPKRVIYISCDPGTLGRDVKYFANDRYHIIRAAAADMFPGTRHVESVVLLSQ